MVLAHKSALNNSTWIPLLTSALIVPTIAYLIVNFIGNNYKNDIDAQDFVNFNLKQLKIYGVGILLAIILIGGLIMYVAAIGAVIINIFLFIAFFFSAKKHG